MRQSHLFTHSLREAPKGEDALNAKFLIRGGFVHKTMAGAYAYLPLGWRVLRKIADVVREEIDAVGGQELQMTALQLRTLWDETHRWDNDVMFHLKDSHGGEMGLAYSHEEPITDAIRTFVQSYKQLPFSVYQIQTKYRNEARAKSGILRGREFLMKDQYSFHRDEADLNRYYDVVADAYRRIFARLGFPKVYYTEASGGAMSHLPSHEFQVPIPAGEDTILACDACLYAYNNEVWEEKNVSDGMTCPQCSGGPLKTVAASEVGNIFRQMFKYSEPMRAMFTDEDGVQKPLVMGAYGIGVSRAMGVLVEAFHDEAGILWPEIIAPFRVHLVALPDKESVVEKAADALYEDMQKAGVDVLYDDRDARAGEKLGDADLIGIPYRVVISLRTLEKNGVEWKRRSEQEAQVVPMTEILTKLI